ncbi:biotin transporter BioY, partial [Halorubrum sp. Atlit-9R]
REIFEQAHQFLDEVAETNEGEHKYLK